MSEYINAGEWLTCENGHRVIQALNDISRGGPVRASDFAYPDGTQPKSGHVMDYSCPQCNKHWARRGLFGSTEPHVEGRGWV